MALTFVFLLCVVLAAVGIYAALGGTAFNVFSLDEHKRVHDRFSDFVPWALMPTPDTVFNKNGSFMAVFRYRGPDLFSATKQELVATVAQLNNSLKRLQGGWALYAVDDRFRSDKYQQGEFPSAVGHILDLERRETFKGTAHHENEYHLVLIYLPPPDVSGKVAQWFYEGDERRANSHQDHLRHFQRESGRIANLMAISMPEFKRLEGSDVMTFLHTFVSTKRQRIEVPSVPMYLDSLLCDTPLTGGLDPKLGDRWIQALTIVGFPEHSRPGLLDGLNQLPFEYRWVTRFVFSDRVDAEKAMKTYQQRWLSLRKSLFQMIRETLFNQESSIQNTDAVNKAADAGGAQEELGSGLVAFGHFTQTIVFFDRDQAVLAEKKAAVERVIDGLGFTTIDENANHNCFDAFLGTLPGNCANNVRQPLLNTINLVHLFPLASVWAGAKGDDNLDGTPLMQVVTDSNTPFRLNLNFGDVGHTLIMGPPGAGKTTLLNALEAAWPHIPGGQVVILDYKWGSKILTHSVGGDFYDLGDEACKLAFQPLADVDIDTERVWAEEWISTLCAQEKVAVTPERKASIRAALKNLASEPRRLRTLTSFKVKVQDKEVKQAITAFTHEGPYGHLLDAEQDGLNYSRWQAFEMRELMKSLKGAVMPVMTYLFHKLEKRFTAATPTLLVIDEGWLALEDPVIAPKFNEWLRTLRSFKVYVVFASQSPSSVAASPLFPIINEACNTKIYLPWANATQEENAKIYRLFSLNNRQIEIIARATPKREYYYTSPLGNRLFSLALGEIGLAYCAATGEEDIARARPLFELSTYEFNVAYLKACGLDWVVDMLPPTLEPEADLQLAAA